MNYHDLEMRIVYANTLNELMDQNPNVICLEADLSKASGTYPVVSDKHKRNYINVGVQEANMIGVAAGLSREGKIPFCASFTAFASRRVYDQITVSVAYANNNVKIIGTSPGITQGPNGGTHMCFQDLAIMRAMPNMHVYSPADAVELRSALLFMAASKQPTYMQLIRIKMPKIFENDYRFNPEKAVTLRKGSDVTLVATGYMTSIALQAAARLEAENISVDLLHYPAIKPFESSALVESAKKTGLVVTVENQNIIGGLGSAVCEAICENYPVRVNRLGIPDKFGEVADQEYLFKKHGFGPNEIVQKCRELVANKK